MSHFIYRPPSVLNPTSLNDPNRKLPKNNNPFEETLIKPQINYAETQQNFKVFFIITKNSIFLKRTFLLKIIILRLYREELLL